MATESSTPGADTATPSPPPPAVTVDELTVTASEGTVYGPVSFTIPATGLTVLCGRGGSGRTALALTLAGRMKPTSGSLTVLGSTSLRDIREKVAIAGVDDIDLIDRDVRLSVTITEHRAWHTLWCGWAKKADEDYYTELCTPIFGDRPLPPLDSYVSSISALDRYLIRLALALNPAGKHPIDMVVMDDLEQVRELDDRKKLLTILRRLAETMPVIVTTVNPLDSYTDIEHTLLNISTTAKETTR